MYDHAAIADKTDLWWQVIREELLLRGISAPSHLTRNDDSRSIWTNPDLLLTQCCGYDLMVNGYVELEPIVTPVYGYDDSENGNYCSYIIVSKSSGIVTASDLKNCKLAVNGYRSHSGYNAMREFMAEELGPGEHGQALLVSGSHYNSMTLVADGEISAGAIDCVTYGIVASYAPALVERLTVLGKSPTHAVLPYAVPSTMDAETKAVLQSALFAAFNNPQHQEVRDQLNIVTCVSKSRAEYNSIKQAEEKWREQMPDFMRKPSH
jgi:ABC-type phosphate/phosphonate transport system substrate-binding protein